MTVPLYQVDAFTSEPFAGNPAAIALMHRLSAKSRERWPAWANPTARVGLPEKKG